MNTGYRPQARDTDPATDRYLFDRLRKLPPWRKAEMLSASSRAAFELALAGIRQRHPGISETELRRRFAALTLGRDACLALFGWDPDRQGW